MFVKHRGYTLIELMVVFSLIGLFSVLTIPSYIRFNRTQEVKQAALLLKSKIRDAQNRSFSGEKSSICTESNILSGFYTELSLNSSSFVTGGTCGPLDFNTNTVSFSSTHPLVLGFYDLSSGSCSVLSLSGNSLRIKFRAVGRGVDFYDWTTQLPISISKLGIKVANTDGNTNYLSVSRTGDIYESKSCP